MKNAFRAIIAVICVLTATALRIQPVSAAPPPNFQSTPIVTTGLNAPSGFDFSPDGRIFILQRTGEVYIYKNGTLLTTPFTVLPSVASGDRGLIGVVFDPDYFNNHYVYFYYTGSDLYNRLVRFDASGDVGTNGPVIIYQAPAQSEMLHVGGALGFGPDGKIYLGMGDNGYHPNAQDLSNPFGKILRINKDGSIPSDNPFYGQTGKLPEIWAYGFRNPFRLTFDSASGRLYVGDVGEASWEEVNLVVKGGNYGWPLAEGTCTSNCTGLIDPTYTYSHNGGSAAVMVGPVYHGSMFPSPYPGSLFMGDYAQGILKYLTLDANGAVGSSTMFDPNVGSVVDAKVAGDGSLYYLDIYPAALYQVIYTTGNTMPVAKSSANVTSGNAPLTVNFSSQGTSDPDGDTLTYAWDFGDGTTDSSPNPTKTYANRGRYIVQLKVSDGIYTVKAIPLVVQAGTPPTVTFSAPANNATYRDGDTIIYKATAVDGSGVTLPDSAFTTNVYFHHQTHIHPFLGPLSGTRQGSFTAPTTGESSPDVYFEIDVTATDQYGLSSTSVVNVYPVKVNMTFVTQPAGLGIQLDGIPTGTPTTIQQVVGFTRELRPVAQQLLNGTYYQLDHWGDNGAAAHFITIPSADTTVTAYYAPMPPFSGQYFTNTSLSGTPTLTRNDPIIDFNWGSQSPDPSVPLTDYSVRWTKTQMFAAGKYIFTTATDDGVRLYVDGKLIIDKWQDQPTTAYTATVDLADGYHDIKMEYYQAGGGAAAKLVWDLTPDQTIVTPTPTPTPGATPTPSPTPTPTGTPTPTPTGSVHLLTVPWKFTSTSGATDQYQSVPPDVLSGKTTLTVTYDLHGLCAVSGDASAIVFDQPANGSWHYVSLSDYGTNCQNGPQTVAIPLSAFSGLDTTQPVGTFHGRFWSSGGYTVDVTDAVLSGTGATPTPTPTPTSTPTPTPTPTVGTQLLTAPWHLTSSGGTAEAYAPLSPAVLSGMGTVTLTYDLHGLCALPGDASAVIFDQPKGGSWHYVSLSDYGTNCQNGVQTVSIPLSKFAGLDTTQPVGTFHTRFWYGGAFTVDITSATVSALSGPTPTPTPQPTGTQLLSTPWALRSASGGTAEAYQSVPQNVLSGKTTLNLTYDIHGLCILPGDASAVIFDQPVGGAWTYVSLSDYGKNCYDGTQTVPIPLSKFTGLNPALPVGTFHTRFWYGSAFAVDISSAVVN